MIRITADSTCDLAPEQIAQNNIVLMPLNVILGAELYEDTVNIRPQDIFDYVEKAGNLPKTAARSIDDYEEFFSKFVGAGETVIHFSISSKASASYNIAAEAQKKFGDSVYVVDSHALSTGQGLLVLRACDLRAEGKTAPEIVSKINALRDKVNTSFIPDRLDYLYMGGRCSKMSLYGAKILNVHPLISMADGQLYPEKKYVGSMLRCMRTYAHDLKEKYPSYDRRRCFVTHSCADPELVALAKKKVAELFDFDEVIETVAGSVITGHCGRNTIGILFIGE